MGVPLGTSFDVGSAEPVDSRIVWTGTIANLNNITNKYQGLITYVTGENKYYYYNTGNQWIELSTAGGNVSLNNVVYTTGNQTIDGTKTFLQDLKVSEIFGTGVTAIIKKIDLENGHLYGINGVSIDYNKRIFSGAIWTFERRPVVNGSGVLLQGEVAGGSNSIINTNYSTLTGLKATNSLTPGQYYRISDFHLMWRNQSINDTGVKSGLAQEPLIVLALSGNKISHEAKSETYPQDTIYYDIDASGSYSWGTINNNTAIPNFKGWIYRRIDHKLNIDIPWDWRNITVNCCRPDMSTIGLYNSATTYNLYNVVKNASNKLYYSIQNNNTNNSLTNTDWWLPVSDFIEGDTYFVTNEPIAFKAYNKDTYFVSLEADTATRIQQPTFTSRLTGQGSFQLINCYDIKIEGGYSNVFLGSNINANTIGNDFYLNTIGNNFNNNTIAHSFNENKIGNSFNSNMIEGSFNNNTIGNTFFQNKIGNNFNTNTIGNGLYYNTIGNYFNSNTIGENSHRNTIGNDFNDNTIRNNFNNNTIGNSFDNNTIGNTFRKNTVEDIITIGNVTGATHIYNSYNTRIFSNSNNTVRLSYFNNNDQLVVTDPTA